MSREANTTCPVPVAVVDARLWGVKGMFFPVLCPDL